MGFLSPWFLGGLVALGLPVWLHLLRRHRATPLPFASLMFFERRTQSSVKHRRLRYLVLLALRLALLALLVLAFAHPYITQHHAAVLSGDTLRILALDNSFSMRATGRLDEAKRAALALVGHGRAQVLAFNSGVRQMSDATADPAVLRAAINAVEPSDARGSFAELARAVRGMTRNVTTPVELHVFSDMQTTGLPASFADLSLGDGVRLVPHSIASTQPNWTVENVRAPRRVYASGKVRVLATIAGFNTPRATRTVSLVLNGRTIESHTVEVPPGGRASVEFLSLESPFGMNRGQVKIDSADALPADDVFYFSLERAEARRVLFLHSASNSRALTYFRAALESPSQAEFQIDASTPEQAAAVAPSHYAFVVLADAGRLPAALEHSLASYVKSGGAVLVSLGVGSAGIARVPVSNQKVEEARYSSREGERFQTAAWLDPSHPSLTGDTRWDDVKFFFSVRIDPAGGRIAARLSDQTPLLVEQPVGEGRVLVFASTFDNVANDLPVHAAFVPFIEQTARYLARLDDARNSFPAGAYFDLRDARETGASVEVIDPAGSRALSLDESTRARNIQLTRGGFYEVHRPNSRDDLVAVNSDRRESDLAALPPETLALWENIGSTRSHSNGAASGEESKPISLWWYCMLAALALALAESVLGNQHLGVDKEAA